MKWMYDEALKISSQSVNKIWLEIIFALFLKKAINWIQNEFIWLRLKYVCYYSLVTLNGLLLVKTEW